VASSTFRSQTL